MPAFGSSDLRVFFGMGVPVSFRGVGTYPDGVPVKGIFDRPMEMKLADQGFGGVDVAIPELRLPVTAFDTMPRNKDTVTVDGTAYRIADTRAEDDGSILCYDLKLVAQ